MKDGVKCCGEKAVKENWECQGPQFQMAWSGRALGEGPLEANLTEVSE